MTEAKWYEDSNVWMVQTKDGQQYRCAWFLPATGTSFKPNIPEVFAKGQKRFKGQFHHSAFWPEEGVELAGKRVAIIGTGSTGIQVMQESAKVASQVVSFMRSPNFAVPMWQRTITEDQIYHEKPHIPVIFDHCRNRSTMGLPIIGTGKKVFDVSKEERLRIWEEYWRRGGFNFGFGSFTDSSVSKEANLETYRFWREKARARISNPEKAALLAPEDPPYWIGTKRPGLEQDYFEMCDRPNVELTNSPIEEITEIGIRTQDGQVREFDVIALCTGYDAVTGGLRTMGIKGRDNLDLGDKWKDGVVTHLGMMANGFPNMYMVYGPQAPTSLTNGPPFIELQCEWILDVLNKQREQGLRILEAKQDEEQKWRENVLSIASRTLANETDSWWNGANVKGKRKEFLLYMGGIPNWHEACKEAIKDWQGFETIPAAIKL